MSVNVCVGWGSRGLNRWLGFQTENEFGSECISLIHRIVESFETVISAFAQQDNITIELTNITIVAELVSL